jgi:hypothetical protein
VTATFVTEPGDDRATDVAACSRFGDGKVMCAKECLALTTVGWTPSPIAAPRFSLIADETAGR